MVCVMSFGNPEWIKKVFVMSSLWIPLKYLGCVFPACLRNTGNVGADSGADCYLRATVVYVWDNYGFRLDCMGNTQCMHALMLTTCAHDLCTLCMHLLALIFCLSSFVLHQSTHLLPSYSWYSRKRTDQWMTMDTKLKSVLRTNTR